jgi:2-methylcitrate dehydratase PrpD
VSGQALVHAVVLGIELQCRVGLILCTPPGQVGVGLSMQGMLGGIGAAVTAGKLMGLDAECMARAIGHAINQAAGLREAHATMGSPFTPGHSARCGVFAALLAQQGLTISDSMIEGVKGFATTYGTDAQPQAAVADLGSRFEILSLAYKPYPSGFVTHPVIDVCLEVARRHRFDAADIERVEVAVNPLTVHLCNRPQPRDRAQALVSFQHWGAVALLFKAAGTAQVTQAVVDDPAVGALRSKFVATARESLAREAAEVRVHMKDGKAFTASVERCVGAAGVPIPDDALAAKTRAQLEEAYAADIGARILDEAWAMPRAPRADAICALLRQVK